MLSISGKYIQRDSLTDIITVLRRVESHIRITASLKEVHTTVINSQPCAIIDDGNIEARLPVAIHVVGTFFCYRAYTGFFIGKVRRSAARPLRGSILCIGRESVFHIPRFRVDNGRTILVISQYRHFTVLHIKSVHQLLSDTHSGISTDTFRQMMSLPVVQVHIFGASEKNLLVAF